MPHLFRPGQGANEHSLEAEWHESKRVGEKGRKLPKKCRISLTFLRFCLGILFLIMQPQIQHTVGGISQLKLGFVIICGAGKMHVVRGMNLHTLSNTRTK